jgi:hypothetical protein
MTIFTEIVAEVTRLAEMADLEIEGCEKILVCRFEKTGKQTYTADFSEGKFVAVSIRFGDTVGIINLKMDPGSDLTGCAREVEELGEPESIDIVSPPAQDPSRLETRPRWERKYSILYQIAGRPVWFGIEEAEGQKHLVSVSIHYERSGENA